VRAGGHCVAAGGVARKPLTTQLAVDNTTCINTLSATQHKHGAQSAQRTNLGKRVGGGVVGVGGELAELREAGLADGAPARVLFFFILGWLVGVVFVCVSGAGRAGGG
jgi:hypothetical protein